MIFLEIILASNAGFCFGVKRAIEMATDSIDQNLPVYTLGPLIHNQQAVEKLETLGIMKTDDLQNIKTGKIVVRSHGVGPGLLKKIHDMGLNPINATCPFVKRAQNLANKLDASSYQVIIVGDKNHPEVLGISEWTENKALIIKDADEAKTIPYFPKIGVIAQTTLDLETFENVISILKEKTKELNIKNTICNATKVRQEEAYEIAKGVDLMIIIGSSASANTKKLTSICRRAGSPTFQIEQAKELEPTWFNNAKRVGVTAGASTPDWIIEEVIKRMSELNEEKVLNPEEVHEVDELEVEVEVEVETAPAEEPEGKNEEIDLEVAGNLQKLHRGDIVTGTVVQVSDNEIMVNVGGKSEGIVSLNELSNRPVDNPSEVVSVGDQIQVYVLRVENEDGNPILSKRRADRQVAWEMLEESLSTGEEIKAPVIEVVKGGLLVDIGVRGFVPASLVERDYVEDLNQYMGKELRLRVIELESSKNKVVLSQKAILDEEYEHLRESTWATLEEGQIVSGVVRRLTNFGAFIDIGGIDGLLHVSELSWGRVDHPKDVLSEGQEIKTKVLGLNRETEKVSLGLKQLLSNPWDTAEERYQVGAVVSGKVLRNASFGAFVEVEPGIEGLVHISQLADHHVPKTEDVVSVGDIISVKVLSVDQNSHRMSLSLREAQAKVAPKPEKIETALEDENSGVKLGDIFGELFQEGNDEQ